MRKCILCRKILGKKRKSFGIPKDEERRLKWSQICGIKFYSMSRICHDHFTRFEIIKTGQRAILMPHAYPKVDCLQESQDNFSNWSAISSYSILEPEVSIMDYKAENRVTQSPVFEINDNESETTASASESSSTTPPLLCKLRKARVRIKKLPADILEKYNFKMTTSQSTTQEPCRTSKRLGAKSVPGHYLSLHKNKPLKELINKKKKRLENLRNDKNIPKVKKLLNLKQYSHLRSKLCGDKITYVKNKNGKNAPNKEINSPQTTATTKETETHSVFVKPLTSLTSNPSSKGIPLDNPKFLNSNLHDKIVNTRPINFNLPADQPLTTNTINLPNYPEVVITRYELPPNNTQTPNISPNDTLTNRINSARVTLLPNSSIQNPTPIYNPNISKIFTPQINRPPTANVLPMIISSMNRVNEPYQPPIVTPALNVTSTENLVQQTYKRPQHLTTTVQTITRPPKISKNNNDPVIVDAPKVLFIKKSAQKNDPLNVSTKKTIENLNGDSDIDILNSSETISVSSEIEKRPEPEVIKRIIYHTKAAQTKFTCPSNICGLVDTDGFNLNCFYCYDIFPLHKWLEFKEHIKQIHHVEEKAVASDSDSEEESNSESTASVTENQKAEVEDNSESIISPSKDVNTPVKNKSNDARDVTNVSTGSFNKSPTKNVNKSLDDIISLDSEGSDEDEDIVDINKNIDNEVNRLDLTPKSTKLTEKVKESANNNLKKSDSEIDEVTKLLPPSLSHIKIKKVLSPPTKTNVNTFNSPPLNNPAINETFIKIPSNFNIQKVIKTIPKSTTIKQIKVNGTQRPRYFVVKKILKPANTDKKPNINISKGMILTKMPQSSKDDTINLDDEMATNNANEEITPQPTKGRGIIFGITNRMVVIEFLLKLKTYPELWRPLPKNTSLEKYDESIKQLCEHLNNRFDLKIQQYEIRLSIQRVKDWYCRILNNIHEHNLKCKNSEAYPHKFPLYFKILNQFLTSDIKSGITVVNLNTKSLASNKIISTIKTPVKETLKPSSKALKSTTEVVKTSTKVETITNPTIVSSNITATTPPSINNSSLTVTSPSSVSPNLSDEDQTKINNAVDNLIEFDGDNLFDTSDDEILSEFDENDWPTIKPRRKIRDESLPKKTKIYRGRFECDKCQKIFKRDCDLRRHRIYHFPPQYECSICLQKFYLKCWAEKCNHQRRRQLYYGEQDNSDGNTTLPDGTERPKPKWPTKIFRFKMICEICGAAYRSIGSLNSHQRDKHLNQRLKCIVCNFTALTNYRIVQHQKKRHIVEPGTVEEVAKKSRARMDSKTPFTVEARQEFDWRREMRSKLKPGEIFFGCCKCRIVFNSRKEKVLHNKMEHPIKESTVLCLLCLPTKMLLSNSNGARRHYQDIHKVPWDEIDALVKRTKPIFNILTKEEIELLNASENYKELLDELLKDREIEPKLQKVEIIDEDEALKAIQNLPTLQVEEKEELVEPNIKIDVVYSPEQAFEEAQDQNVFVDGIIDHDYNNEEEYHNNEHNYSEDQLVLNGPVLQEGDENYVHQNYNESEGHLAYHIEYNEEDLTTENQQQPNDLEYMQGIADEFVEGELAEGGDLVEECIVVEEECIDDIVEVDGEYY